MQINDTGTRNRRIVKKKPQAKKPSKPATIPTLPGSKPGKLTKELQRQDSHKRYVEQLRANPVTRDMLPVIRPTPKKKKQGFFENVADTASNLARGVSRTATRSLHKVYGRKAKPGEKPGKGAIASASVKGVSGGLPFRMANNVGMVIAEDPKVLKRIPKDLVESAASAPAGIAKLVTDPVGGAKMIVKDYEHRFGGSDKEIRERLKKEGITPELLDVATVAGTAVGGAGRAAQGLAKAGKLGKAAERIATERPRLRVSGGTAVEQDLHPNFVRNVVRSKVDKRRAKVQAKRAKREDAPAIVREAEERGEVTPIRKRSAARIQRKMVAKEKGVRLAQMKAEQQREVSAARKNVKGLSKAEQRGLKYAMQYGIVDAKTGRRVMERHKARVADEREGLSKSIPKRQDELANIQFVIDHADEVFTPRLREVVKAEQKRSERVGSGDPGFSGATAQQRRYAAQAELLGVKRVDGESDAQFLRRVKKAHTDEGLARPGYFPSEKRPEGVFSAFAAGGTKANRAPKAYTGVLTRTGRENVSPEAHVLGVAKNIKRKYNWNLVADNFDKHTFEWSRNKTINELKDELERRGIDPKSVSFWNPGKFKRAQQAAGEVEGADLNDPTFESKSVANAVDASSGDLGKLESDPEAFANTTGWSVVPRAVHDEIHTELRPSGAAGRVYDIAKGKASRVLLANPAWLQFQVGSNALLTGLAGVGPVDAVKAQAWWRKLTPEERAAVEPYIGVHKFYDEQRHLGAAANNKVVNAYRALKTTGLYQAAHKANPFDALFRADNAQNNFFRRAIFYNRLKREAYRRMGENGKTAMAAQQRIVDALSLGQPDDIMRALLKDQKQIERHAKAVTDFLGDWTTYTANERRKMGRAVMFYGFLRFSTKLTFYTLPVEHPLMTTLLTQLGRLQHDELEKIFGADVPPWEIGNLYSSNGKRMFEARRLNPFFNALQYQSPGSLAGVISPAGQVLLNQIAGKNVGFDKLYTTDGQTAYKIKGGDLDLGDRFQIALAEILKLSPYYRAAEKTGIPGVVAPLRGKQSSDSSLIFPQPIKYKRASSAAKNEELKKRQDRAIIPSLTEEFAPFLGAEGESRVESARSYEQSKKKKPKVKRSSSSTSLFDSGSSGGSLFDSGGPGGSLFD